LKYLPRKLELKSGPGDGGRKWKTTQSSLVTELKAVALAKPYSTLATTQTQLLLFPQIESPVIWQPAMVSLHLSAMADKKKCLTMYQSTVLAK
jgi:hypothetical protein